MRMRDTLYVVASSGYLISPACGSAGDSAEEALSRPKDVEAFASLAPLTGSGVVGSFEFRQAGKGLVELKINLEHCDPGTTYFPRLNTGTGCDSQAAQGVAWEGGQDGLSLPAMTCTSDKTAYKLGREGPLDPFVWTFDANQRTSVIGRVAIVVNPVTDNQAKDTVIACGVVD